MYFQEGLCSARTPPPGDGRCSGLPLSARVAERKGNLAFTPKCRISSSGSKMRSFLDNDDRRSLGLMIRQCPKAICDARTTAAAAHTSASPSQTICDRDEFLKLPSIACSLFNPLFTICHLFVRRQHVLYIGSN